MKRREMRKLVTTGEVSVRADTYAALEKAARSQGKSTNLLADEIINAALDRAGDS